MYIIPPKINKNTRLKLKFISAKIEDDVDQYAHQADP